MILLLQLLLLLTYHHYQVDAAFGSAGRTLTRDETLDRFRFLKAAIKWSRSRKELGAYLLGDPRLHAAAGQVAWDLARLEKEHNTSGSGGSGKGGKSSSGGGSDLGSQLAHLPWAEKGIKHMVRVDVWIDVILIDVAEGALLRWHCMMLPSLGCCEVCFT